ncbi:hypothetical protein KEM60_00772 [Austwickia sp. TVS 96-490-7B]|nr:hypothetical protein [Austwickia sp. TVS 96-490-7B]
MVSQVLLSRSCVFFSIPCFLDPQRVHSPFFHLAQHCVLEPVEFFCWALLWGYWCDGKVGVWLMSSLGFPGASDSRNSHIGVMGEGVLDHDGIGADPGAVGDVDRPEDVGSGADEDVVADSWCG